MENTAYHKLKDIIDEIDILISKGVISSDPEFQAWKTKAERFLINKYGDSGLKYKKFIETSFSVMTFAREIPHSERVKACRNGLNKTKAII